MSINEISWNEEGEGNSTLLESPALADFKDVNSLAQAFIDTKSMVGNSIRIPSAEAGDDDVKSFHESLISKVPGLIFKPDADDDDGMKNIFKSLGLPDDSKGYGDIDISGTGISAEDVEFMKSVALEANMTKRQFKEYSDKIIASSKTKMEDAEIAHNQSIDKLQREWGDTYDIRVAKAAKMAEVSGAPADLVEAIKLGKAPPNSIKWMFNLAERVGGEDFQVAAQTPSGDGITPAEARDRAQEIRNQLDDDNISGPRRQEMIDRMIKYDAKAKLAA